MRTQQTDTAMHSALLLGVFFLPLKLSIGYVFLIPALLWFLLHAREHSAYFAGPVREVTLPLVFFVVALFLSSLFGFDPAHSLATMLPEMFFISTMFLFARYSEKIRFEHICVCMLAGASVAGVAGLLNSAIPELVPRIFLGRVTESGQLALLIPLGFGLKAFLEQEIERSRDISTSGHNLRLFLWGSFNFLGLVVGGLASHLQISAALIAVFVMVLFTSLLLAVLHILKFRRTQRYEFAWLYPALMLVCLPILGAELVCNMKRGPWFAVLFSSCVYFWISKKRLLPAFVVACFAVLLLFEPVRERVNASEADFNISGGRRLIWEIGTELAARYPLGIGYQNSPYLRDFAPEIPAELKHFHSNFINIVVEGGWISMAAYMWWLVALLYAGFRYPHASRSAMRRGIACAIVSWQVAGLVEYNFGDSEVMLVALTLAGILTSLYARDAAQCKEISTSPALNGPLPHMPFVTNSTADSATM